MYLDLRHVNPDLMDHVDHYTYVRALYHLGANIESPDEEALTLVWEHRRHAHACYHCKNALWEAYGDGWDLPEGEKRFVEAYADHLEERLPIKRLADLDSIYLIVEMAFKSQMGELVLEVLSRYGYRCDTASLIHDIHAWRGRFDWCILAMSPYQMACYAERDEVWEVEEDDDF